MVYLASDPDREGEAISWHLKDALGLKDKDYERVVFNEITHDKVLDAFKHPRKIDDDLVRRFGRDKTNKILNTYRRLKQLIIKCLKIPLFPIVLYRHHKAKMIVITDSYLNRLNETINCIEKNKDKEYITIYNKLFSAI